MNVLFAHDGPLFSDETQSNYFATSYSNNLVERYTYLGEKVTFLMRLSIKTNISNQKFNALSHPSFNFINVPNFKSLINFRRIYEAKKVIRKAVEKSDIVIVRLPSEIGFLTKEIADELSKPVIVELVACYFDALWNYDWRGKLISFYKYYRVKIAIYNSSHVIYVTQSFLQKRYPTRGKSINCSNVELISDGIDVLNLRLERISNLSDKLILSTIAAVDVSYKGQSDVINTIYNLKLKGIENIYYYIVGDGNNQILLNLVTSLGLESNVFFLGPISHDKIFNFIDSIDLYIQPSRAEALSRSIIEALNRACPVIASKVGGNPELVCSDALFEAGNLRSLENVLINIDKLKLRKWAIENFNRSKNYSADVLNNRRFEFYDKFLQDYKINI